MFRYHLGKTALVRDASCFPELQRLGLHAITLDGTKGSNKGVIRGGYIKPNSSLLDLYENYKDEKDKFEEARRVEDVEAMLDSVVRSKERLALDVQKEKTKLERAEAQLGLTREKRNSAQRYRIEYAERARQAEDAAHRIRFVARTWYFHF